MNDDISTILERLHINIKLIEDQTYNKNTLDEIRSDYFKLLELLKLFLLTKRDSYYGYFLMNMVFECDFTFQNYAGIKLNTYPPVFSANPLLLCSLSLKEILFTICHELEHLLFNHPAEMVRSNPSGDEDVYLIFNYAADASVNDYLVYGTYSDVLSRRKPDNDFLTPPKDIIFSETLNKEFGFNPKLLKSQNYLYYFLQLMENSKVKENVKNNKEKQTIKKKTGAADGNGSSDERNDGLVTRYSDKEYKDHGWNTEDTNAEDLESVTNEFILDVDNSMSNEARGSMPGTYQTIVERIKNPPILSWQSLLKKYIGSIVAGSKKTKMKLNRRQPERFDLSGSKEDKVLKIVIAIDVSGSLTDDMVATILNEIYGILSTRHHDLTIIECDCEVRKVYKVKKPSDVQHKIIGRGGTMFKPVIEYVNSNKYFRDALLIYFTDGYGETSIPRPMTYRNIWVILDGKKENLSVEEPYGAVLEMKTHE